MAISKWLLRKSFDEATAKAEEIRRRTQERNERNSGLFTAAQENLRRELRLHSPQLEETSTQKCLKCHKPRGLLKPSRGRVHIKRR